MRWASIILSLLTVPLVWLVLPALLFPPAALLLGFLSYRQARQKAGSQWQPWHPLLHALPMLLALVAGGLAWYILATGYQA